MAPEGFDKTLAVQVLQSFGFGLCYGCQMMTSIIIKLFPSASLPGPHLSTMF